VNSVYSVLSSSVPSVVRENARAGCTFVFFDVHRVGCTVLYRLPLWASRIARDFFSRIYSKSSTLSLGHNPGILSAWESFG
jgi:hypothetical protein